MKGVFLIIIQCFSNLCSSLIVHCDFEGNNRRAFIEKFKLFYQGKFVIKKILKLNT